MNHTAIAFSKKQGRYFLPKGFHLVNDLVPLFRAKEGLIRNQLSSQAKKRLSWFDHYKHCGSVSLTCRYFGISRQTFYEWWKRYNPNNLISLEDASKAPKTKRRRTTTPEQELRVIQLRKQYIRYGKEKLVRLYEQEYKEKISSWHIQCVIEKYRLYCHPKKTAKIAAKRRRSIKKKRITDLRKKASRSGFLLCFDVVVIYWNNAKKYIFTAIDNHSKTAFAWMYNSKSSFSSQDFLLRLRYLFAEQVENIQTDNGSEFHGLFNQACIDLNINHYWSRNRTPKDNAVNERFNRTIQEEFINLGNFTPETTEFNRKLADWLIEYNFHRPHQSLGYQTPAQFASGNPHLSTMCPSSTIG